MSQLLEKAIEAMRKLSEEEQEAFATLIFAELEAEKRWDALLEASQDLLLELADEALNEYRVRI